MRHALILACTMLLGGSAVAAGEDDDGGPIVLDLSKGTRKADGSYELPSPVKMAPDGSLEWSNGRRMSRKEAMQELIRDGNARGPDGQRIDPDQVIVNDDGSLSRRDGTRVSKPASGGDGDFSLTQQAGTTAAVGEEDEEEAPTDRAPADTAAPATRRPASAVGGIELISGGNSRDGVATVGEIPVLR